LALLRWFIASGGYLALAPFIGRPKTKFDTKDLPRLFVISLANVPGYHLAINYAETSVSAGLAGLLISLGPVFVVLFSSISLKEKIHSRIVFAILLALGGSVLLSLPNLGSGVSSLIGPLEVIIAAISYAVFGVLSKPLVHKYGPTFIAIWAGTIGTLTLLPLLSNSFKTQVASMSVLDWSSVLYLSLLSTVLGYTLYYTLVSRGSVSRLAIQLYLIPIVSVLGGIFLLGESISVFTVAGGSAMLVSIWFATRAKS
jgi:drug/metabolite transporter (DMT)-like permease